MTKKEAMKGKKISREELEAQDWKLLFKWTDDLLWFGKDQGAGEPRPRIVWNKSTQVVDFDTKFPALSIK